MCDFYYTPMSPPCRSVLMLAKALNVKLNLKKTSVMAGETKTPEFLKINPQHTIPTLVDNGFSIWESRAILIYLVDKYAKDNLFYPKDLRKRAIVNRMMYFDMGTLNKSFLDYFMPILMKNEEADPEKLKKLEETMNIMDIFLKDSKYAACDEITIADFTLFVSISTLETCGYDIGKHANVARWYNLCKLNLPGVEENEEGVAEMKNFVAAKHKHSQD